MGLSKHVNSLRASMLYLYQRQGERTFKVVNLH